MPVVNPLSSPVRVRTRSIALRAEPPSDKRRQLACASSVDPRTLICSRSRLRTPKPAQQEHLQRNLRRFGCVLPVLVDERNHVISGHAVVAAAIAIGMDQVPIMRIEGLNGAEIAALRISLHKIEELSSWTPDVLRAELEVVGNFDVDLLTFTAFSSEEIDVILNPNEQKETKPNPDDVLPLPRQEVVSRLGDVWCFDKGHRLACGSAHNPEIYGTLMGGGRARLVIADTPFNVPVEGHVSGRPGVREFPMASGEMTPEEFTTFLQRAFRLVAAYSLDGSLHLFFMDWRHVEEMMAAGRSVYDEFKNLIVWTKTNAGMGSLWRSQHELIFVWKKGTARHVNNVDLGRHGRWRSNVWSYPGANSFGRNRTQELADHVTPKNVSMIKDAILDVTQRGDLVLDCFCGAGTTLVAAHRARRIGMGIELDPGYVDAAVRRMEGCTGQPARHAETGLTFAETATARKDAEPGKAA